MPRIDWTFLGNVPYCQALDLQYAHAGQVLRGQAHGRLFLLEHPPTVTLGRAAQPANLRLSAEEYARRGIEVVSVKRGGDVTYHGPGQLVGYPVCDLGQLKLSVPAWVRANADCLVDFLRLHAITAVWSDTHPGVWVGQRKIGALGFHIAHRVSTHGFALNLQPQLEHFDTIIPCGLHHLGVTSMAQLGSCSLCPAQVAGSIALCFARRLGLTLGPQVSREQAFEEMRDVNAIPAWLG